jgi:thioredoxin-like negative regulator of GroEL
MTPVAEKIAREFDLELVPINIDKMPALAQARGVSSIPALVLVDDEGVEVARSIGALPKSKVAAALGLTAA